MTFTRSSDRSTFVRFLRHSPTAILAPVLKALTPLLLALVSLLAPTLAEHCKLGDKGAVVCGGCDGKGPRSVPCWRCRGKRVLRCVFCRGTGKWTCPACGGDGQVKWEDGEKDTCHVCSGKGSFQCT